MVFFRDRFTDKLSIDPFSSYFRLGTSLFETILYNGERLCHFERHMDRLEASVELMGFSFPPVDVEGIVWELLGRERLLGRECRVNVQVFLDYESGRADIMVAARPYVRPRGPVSLYVPNIRVSSEFFRFKSGSYHFNMHIRREAQRRGFFDALIVGVDNSVLDASAASLLFKKGDRLFSTPERFRLKGVSLEVVRERVGIEEVEVKLYELGDLEAVFVVNSLLGALPVSRIGDLHFPPDLDTSLFLSSFLIF